MQAPPLIECTHLFLQRGRQDVLKDISLSIHAGEHLAILGPNGSGKSSFIKTITRECYPRTDQPGYSLKLLGSETWNVFELRAHFGIITPDLQKQFDPTATGLEVVLSGFFVSVRIWPADKVTRAMLARSRELLRWLDIESLEERQFGTLSSGEARRLLVARALVRDAEALILDEATNNLDMSGLHEFRETLRRVAKAGKTVVLVTHTLADVIPEIKRIIFFKKGRIVGDGPKNTMLTQANLSRLFDVPLRLAVQRGYYSAF